MPTLNPAKKSFQWMIHAGVSVSDVNWLEGMNGSQELHLPVYQKRVENIFKVAVDGVLSSEKPAEVLMLSLN
jgi:hypothetical protein